MKITATCKCGARIAIEDAVSVHTEITPCRNEDSPPCPNHGRVFQCNCFPTSIRHEDGSECNCPA